MNNEKKLINYFKTFFQKTCLQIIRNHDKILKQWLYFNTMLSQQNVDYSKIQRYIESLNKISIKIGAQKQIKLGSSSEDNTILMNSAGFLRKKQQIVQKLRNQNQFLSINNKTLNGDRFKQIINDHLNSSNEMMINLNNQQQNKIKWQQKSQSAIAKILGNLNILHRNFIQDHKKLQEQKETKINAFQDDIRKLS